MPRDGSGVYSKPAGTTASPNTTIESAKYNATVDDLVVDANAARPITAGGTGRNVARLLDGTWRFENTADPTKTLAVSLTALTAATQRNWTVQDKDGTVALTSDVSVNAVVGQCRLVKSGANIVLQPFQGNNIKIAGLLYQIPAAGVSLAPGALATNTDLNVYVLQTAGVLSLEAVTTAHSTDSTAGNIGVEIKTGDNTRTLVGKVRLTAGPVFVDGSAQRFVLNWFNRQGVGAQNGFSADRTTSSGTFVEVNSEIRCEFLTWVDEAVAISCAGAANNGTAGRGVITTVGLDGVNAEPGTSYSVSPTAGADYGYAITIYRHSLTTEGYHYYTVLGRTDGSGTATYRSSASANGRSLLSVMTRG